MYGITLVEMLVVIAVVGVLVGLMIPALGAARRAGIRTKCTTHSSQCSFAILAYTVDARDMFPMFASPAADPAFENGGIGLPYSYQAMHWPIAAGAYLGPGVIRPAQLCPGSPVYRACFRDGDADYLTSYPPSYVHTAEYWFSYTLFSDPTMWLASGPGDIPRLRRSVGVPEVLFPSAKGMLIEPWAFHAAPGADSTNDRISLFAPDGLSIGRSVARVDGSTGQVRADELVPGRDPSGTPGPPVMNTPDGCRGTDFYR